MGIPPEEEVVEVDLALVAEKRAVVVQKVMQVNRKGKVVVRSLQTRTHRTDLSVMEPSI